MYLPLNETGKSNALTNASKFNCPSLTPPHLRNFSAFDVDTSYNNREYYVSPAKKMERTMINDINLEKSQPSPPTIKNHSQLSPATIKNHSQPSPPTIKKEPLNKNRKNLLPVLDTNFNLREICKQCILLEDHLSNEEKRCSDCCIKHFLAIEALGEEAITLDKNQEHVNITSSIPPNIREIQKIWFVNPEKNSLYASQELRKIRKEIMEDSFPIIFNSNQSCNGNLCKI